MGEWSGERYGRELAAARDVLDKTGAHTYGKGGRELSVAERIQWIDQNHAAYIHTINLNVPAPYRQPQLDLSMVRMRDAIARLEDRVNQAEETAKRAQWDLDTKHAEHVAALDEMVKQRQAREKAEARVTELLEANTAEVTRRRGFETEANQAYCESRLLRNECIRLREVHSVLAGFIEGIPENIHIPDEVIKALAAVFPPDAAARKDVNDSFTSAPAAPEVRS
jgi:hypothetical protein